MQLPPFIYDFLIRPNWFNQKHIHQHINYHCDLKNKYVLDFGSGTGANCTMFPPEHYIGLDSDLKRIEYSSKKYPEYRFNVINQTKLPIPSHSIDIIVIVAVLHHIPLNRIDYYIKEFHRILKKDESEIIILEPCLFNKLCLKNWLMKKLDRGEFIQDEQTYLSYFKKAGFNTTVINKFPKGLIYNELLFKAFPK